MIYTLNHSSNPLILNLDCNCNFLLFMNKSHKGKKENIGLRTTEVFIYRLITL